MKTAVLLTGLCLQGNKGGPAIALSLMQVLRSYRPNLEFVMSVPDGAEWPHELHWAKMYGVEVIPTFQTTDVLPPYAIKRFPGGLTRAWNWWRTARKADVVLDMSAISYIGPPAQSESHTFIYGRFVYFVASKLARRPFLAWTQSLGPFTGRFLPRAAKMDLKRQPVVFCRGEEALANVRQLLPSQSARSFPDVAIMLNYDQDRGLEHLGRVFDSHDPRKIITISPNAVSYLKGRGSEPNEHINVLKEIASYFIKRGYPVYLVPHTFRPERHDPMNCDYGVCQELLKALSDTANSDGAPIRLLDEDLSPIKLKSIIAASHLHIGARYHSIIAALSSGTPCMALAWHEKYADILDMYGIKEFVHPAFGPEAFDGTLEGKLTRLIAQAGEIQQRLQERQPALLASVRENAILFCSLMDEAGQ